MVNTTSRFKDTKFGTFQFLHKSYLNNYNINWEFIKTFLYFISFVALEFKIKIHFSFLISDWEWPRTHSEHLLQEVINRRILAKLSIVDPLLLDRKSSKSECSVILHERYFQKDTSLDTCKLITDDSKIRLNLV